MPYQTIRASDLDWGLLSTCTGGMTNIGVTVLNILVQEGVQHFIYTIFMETNINGVNIIYLRLNYSSSHHDAKKKDLLSNFSDFTCIDLTSTVRLVIQSTIRGHTIAYLAPYYNKAHYRTSSTVL